MAESDAEDGRLVADGTDIAANTMSRGRQRGQRPCSGAAALALDRASAARVGWSAPGDDGSCKRRRRQARPAREGASQNLIAAAEPRSGQVTRAAPGAAPEPRSGRMMTKQQFIDWAGTAGGGNIIEEEADKKWSEYESDGGPASAPLRLWMAVDGENVTPEKVTNGDHRSLGKKGEAEFDSTGLAMLVRGSGGLGGGAPNITGTAPAPGGQARAEAEAAGLDDSSAEPTQPGASGSEASNKGLAPAPALAKAGQRARRFGADAAVKKAKTTATCTREKVLNGLRDAEATLLASVADLELLPADQLAEHEVCLRTGLHRLEFLRAVMAPPDSAADSSGSLANLLHEVEAHMRGPPSDGCHNLMTVARASAVEWQVFDALDMAQNMQEARLTLLVRRQ